MTMDDEVLVREVMVGEPLQEYFKAVGKALEKKKKDKEGGDSITSSDITAIAYVASMALLKASRKIVKSSLDEQDDEIEDQLRMIQLFSPKER